MLAAPEERAIALLSQFPILDAEAALGRVQCPLLYIGGSRPRFDESGVLALRPEAWIARVAGSGHFVQLFARPQVEAMVRQFLRFLPASKRA